MKEAKYTKGPWTYVSGTTTCEKVLGSDGKVTADTWWCRGVEESEANARLISAAPNLLEELQESTEMLIRIMESKDWGAIEEQIQDNQSAIAKALGQSE